MGLKTGRGTARAEDAQGTPTQSHISPSILVYEDSRLDLENGSSQLRIPDLTGSFDTDSLGSGTTQRLGTD